jgi:subtilisin family serine protease
MAAPRAALSAVLACLLLCSITGFSSADPRAKDGEVILKFRPGTPQSVKDSILAVIGGSPIRKFKRIQAEHDRISGSVSEAIGRVKNHPSVLLIEPNYIVSVLRTPNDPQFSQLWGLNNSGQTGGTPGADVDALHAWDIQTGSSSVVVAIIDTGVDYIHPDLAANIWTNAGEVPGNGVDDDGNGFIDDVRGWDFVNRDNNPADDFGHGTHCAGTVGAVGNNGLGVAGVSWSVRIMPLKFLGSDGFGTTADAISCIEYATAMGANIMSNSWGGGGFSEALRLAIQDAGNAGILFVAAAGNSGRDTDIVPNYPSGYDLPNVIAVAATDHNDQLAVFSNYGAVSVDLAAPGVNIVSTVPSGGYASLSGTSMATPHVSGILALIKAEYPLLSMTALKAKLFGSVDPIPALSGRMVTGGRVNAFRALERPDSITPAPVADLNLVETSSGGFRLEWTATGDDGPSGRASAYDLRYATFPLTEENFETGTSAPAPDPEPAGATQSASLAGLDFSTTYYVALRVLDEIGNASPISNVVTGTTLGRPILAYDPPAIEAALLTGGTATRTLTLQNAGEGTLDFTIVEEVGVPHVNIHPFLDLPRGAADPRTGDPVTSGAGGPDHFGYRWSDSDQPGGPSFEWVDITSVGTRLPLRFLDENFGPVPLGFSFPFYGTSFANVNVCTHGWLSFTNRSTQYTNQPLPNTGAPENQLAVFWEDLDFGGAERAYYHSDGNRFIVEYLNVPRTGGGATYTFEVLLYPNGSIVYQYLTMSGFTTGSTIGIQNGTRDDGLTVAFNTAYVHDGLAVRFTSTPEWFHVTPVSGRVLAPGSLPLQIAIDASDLQGGVYPGTIRLRTNDPSHLETEVPIELSVTGAPDIDLSRSALDFGSLFVGASRAESVVVFNRGTDALHVSSITVTPPAYTVTPSAMTLSPGERGVAIVTFRPGTPISYPGTLRLQSDDPDEAERTLPLSGVGLVPPDIAAAPDAFAVSLLVGESAERSLSVRNEGGSDLFLDVGYEPVEFEGSAVATPPTQPPGARAAAYADFLANAGSAPYEPASPSPRPGVVPLGERVLAAMSDSAVLFRDDMEHGVNGWSHSALAGSVDLWAQSNSRAASGVTSWRVSQHASAGSDALVSPTVDLRGYRDATLSFRQWYAFDDCGDTAFEADGAIVQASTDDGATWVTLTPLGGYPYVLDDICSNPLANMPAYSHAGGMGSTFIPAVFDLTPLAGAVVRLRFRAGWDCGNCGTNEGWYVDDVTVFSRSPRIIAVTPESATIGAGGALDLDVRFNAGALFGGDYRTAVLLQSNDPDESPLRVPASIHITGAPDIAWSPAALDFGSRFIGSTTTDTLALFNAGTDVLHVTEVSVDASGLSVNGASFLLAPGTHRDLEVTFAPAVIAEVSGNLTIRSDDSDEPVVMIPIHGNGVAAPDVDLAPASVSASVPTGQTATRTLTVRNSGGSDLVFRAFSADAPASPPPPPDSSVAIPDSLQRPTENVTRPSSGAPSVQAVYAGTHLRFGITNAGEIMPFQFPIGNEHLQLGTWLSGYTVAYVVGGSDRVAYAVNSDRVGLVAESYREIENTPALAVVEVTVRTTDGALRLRRLIRFVKSAKAIRVETTIENQMSSSVSNVVFKEEADWDVDSNYMNDWDYDRDRHLVYASMTHYTGIASGRAPDLMDINGWNDYYTRTTTVDFPVGPVHDFDGLAVLHFNLGTLPASGSQSVVAAYGAGDDLADLRNGLDRAVEGIDWLAVTPASGTVPAGGALDLTLEFDPGFRGSGDYAGRVVVESNDPDEPSTAASVVMTVIGRPIIAVEPSVLDLGSLFVGASTQDTLRVRNDGVDPLLVTGITLGDPSYSAAPDSFAVAPFGSRIVIVTFHPVTPGNKASVLSLNHNAAGSPTSIALLGTGLVPPDVALDPSSLAVETETGRVETRTVLVRNEGGSDLIFTASGFGVTGSTESGPPVTLPEGLRAPTANATAPSTTPPSVQAVYSGTHLQFGITPYGEVMPFQYPIGTEHLQVGSFISGYTVAYVVFGLDRLAYSVNESRQNMAVESYTEIENTPSRVIVLVTTRTADGFLRVRRRFVFRRDDKAVRVETTLENLTGAALENVVFKENADWDMDNDYADDTWNYDPDRHMAFASDAHFAAIGAFEEPTLMDVNGWNDYNRRATVVDIPVGPVVGFDGLETLHFEIGALVPASSRTIVTAYATGNDLEELRLTMSRAIGLVDWFTVSPESGVVPAGGVAGLEVRFDPARLPSGEYLGAIEIACNDPDEPSPLVNLTMTHTARPVIAISPGALDFGSVYLSQSSERSFSVRNEGVTQLVVASIASTSVDYTASPTAFEVAPGDVQTVTVTFHPSSPGRNDTPLQLTHNAAGSPTAVALGGTGVIPPAIAVRPGGLVAAAMPGRRASKLVSICNEGGSDLRFDIGAPTPLGGGVAPASYRDLGKGESDPRPGIQGVGGPDLFGHVWLDSDQPGGPSFEWVDIRDIGTTVPFGSLTDDANLGPYPIGFSFPYFGSTFSQFRVCSNGWISFTSTSSAFVNQPLPNAGPGVPENLIAMLWDDLLLNAGTGSNVSYYSDGDRLIVQYTNVRPIGVFSPTPHTFEVILHRNGEIVFQYLSVGSLLGGATVGIQNAGRNDGLTVSFNTPYLHPNLSVRLVRMAPWLTVTPRTGRVVPGTCAPLSFDLDASELEPGDYSTNLHISSDDPAHRTLAVPVTFHVGVTEAAACNFDPNTLNRDSQGRKVVMWAELPPGLDPARVLLESVRFQDVLAPAQDSLEIGDWNGNGIPDLKFRFERAEVEALLTEGASVPVSLTGEVENQTWFAAHDAIRVIRPHVVAPNGRELLVWGTTYVVRWKNPSGWHPHHAAIYASTDSDSSWSLVADGVAGESYSWTVPSVFSPSARVRVYLFDEAGVMGYDSSDEPFGIVGSLTGVESSEKPVRFAVRQNAPNPFNPVTVIGFDLPSREKVRLEVFQPSGRHVRTLVDRVMPAGRHEIKWDGRDERGAALPSGVYLYRVRAGSHNEARRMLLLK